MQDFAVILLAAGLGKRMNSALPKVLHPLGGKPLVAHALKTAESLKPKRIAVVIGHGAAAVRAACNGAPVAWVTQKEQLGTGHAVGCTKDVFQNFAGTIVILNGDVPLIRSETLRGLLDSHHQKQAALTFVTARLPDPRGYGRIVRDGAGRVLRVVEERDASAEEAKLNEINAGIYAVAADFLFSALATLTNANRQKEYYLTDIVAAALSAGKTVAALEARDAREILGINSREELAAMEKVLQERINRKWMEAGVTLKDPQTTYIDESARIGRDTTIGPNSHILGETVIGERCRIDGSAYLANMRVGSDVHVKFSVVMSDAEVGDGAIIGPFAHLRPGTSLGRNVHIGNFVEAKAATLGDGTKANHLTYLGDVTIGRDTNIGAGTITCNYDGFKKYPTKIGDRVQIGSDSTLVAPIVIGDDAYIATATTVRHDAPAGALVYNDRAEKVKPGWTEQKRKKMSEDKS
ncbi:MAG TPA: bifunctional UDP-N-acetylglucosamine diphosphorylase/glucosamine-1-phosphate N-acetyltransferase GlmU [Candidatus Binatia bacterium]